ncbi:MAG: MFS transporter [Eubacteriales bacterium]|nr:MFS transporter [Eubacteriales bacterium]
MSKETGKKCLLVTALVFVGLFLGNYGQYQLAAVPSMIYEKFSLTDTQFSSIMTSPMVPAIFLSIVLGVLADRFGIKKTVMVCYAVSTLGFVLRVFAGSYGMMFAAMMMTGVGCTVLNGNLSKIVSSLYPAEKIGKVVGILMAGSTGSMAVAYGTTAFYPSLEAAFWVTAVAAVILSVFWLVLVREKDFGGASQSAAETVPVREALKVSVRSGNVWLMGLALLMLLGGATVISNFQVAYLTSVKGYSENLAGTFGTVLMIGSIIGSVAVPSCVFRSKKPGLWMLVMGLIAAVCTVLLVQLPTAGIYAASFLNGCLRSGIIAAMMALPVMFSDIGPKYAGMAGGFAVTLELLGAVVVPTYVIIPLAGGNMLGYFYLGAGCIAVSSVLIWVLMGRLSGGK